MNIISDCDVVVHKQCTVSLADHCYPATQKKAGTFKTKRPGSAGKYEGDSFEGTSTDHPHSTTVIIDKVC